MIYVTILSWERYWVLTSKNNYIYIIMLLEFQENVVPGDGNCLFHSLGKALNIPQGDIRIAIALYLEKNRKQKINGLKLEDWLIMEKDMGLDGYCRMIRQNGVWGGNMELNIFTKMYKLNVFVLMKDLVKKNFKMVSSYVFDNNANNIFLLYDGVHYNYLRVSKNMTDIRTL